MRKILIIPLLIFSFGCWQNKKSEGIKFNREEWLKGDWVIRGKMVDNLIDDSLLIGKSKKEIVDLLGKEGDTTDNFSYPVDIGYETGPYGIGGLWLFYLNIQFDSLSNKVIEVRCAD